MTVDDTRYLTVLPTVPRPRAAADDPGAAGDTAPPARRRTRPLDQYWDFETPGWRTRDPEVRPAD
jgi:hypothetical protein